MGNLKDKSMKNNEKENIHGIEEIEIVDKKIDGQCENQEDLMLNKMKQRLGIKRILKPDDNLIKTIKGLIIEYKKLI